MAEYYFELSLAEYYFEVSNARNGDMYVSCCNIGPEHLLNELCFVAKWTTQKSMSVVTHLGELIPITHDIEVNMSEL